MRSGWFGLPFFGAKPEPEVVSCTLSGGGSRASFQIGALAYLYRHDPDFTPTVFVGASAGAILAAGLSQYGTPEEQQEWVDLLEEVWLGMRGTDDMFTPREWFRKLQDEGPSWLEIVHPTEPPKPARPILPFFRRDSDSPDTPDSPDSPVDPVELALMPDQELRAEWSLQHLSALAGNVGRLPRIGSDMSAIWAGLERTRSMYRPGPVLQALLEPAVFKPERVPASGMTLRVAMVALESGDVRFMTERGTLVGRMDEPFDDESHDLVLGLLASCSIPAVFRAVPIGDETYVDGGTRENLPAEMAIGLLGASRNYVISSQDGGVQRRANMADDNIFSVVMRSTEILIDEAGRDELEYAISAGATTIYPEISVHDAMTVHPALMQINRDYGWMRAAEVHLGLERRHKRAHRRITEQRIKGARLEQRFVDDPESATAREELVEAKFALRAMMGSAHEDALPAGAQRWWREFERHAQPITAEAWWAD
ncbi:MAG: patatin-like phospholipase family protein [Propionibacterium sp.]|nr:patatin-like phospholipase family protein [Propionibacterium sp.]